MNQELIVDCPHCMVRVKTKANTWLGVEEDSAFFLLQCPSCKNPLFGQSYSFQDDYNHWSWTDVERLWPTPSVTEVNKSVPEAARKDIRDAQKCLSHGIYSAAAVLCGRALERLIQEKTGTSQMIGKGLKELREKAIIDQRLLNWAEALRNERNIGAHASDQDTTREDAQDVIDFTVAIFDYVYVLSEKYEKYMQRKQPPSA